MDKNKFIIIALILLAAISGVLYFYNYLGGLKVYKNEKYGFSLKYPENTALQENTGPAEIARISKGDNPLDYGIVIYINQPITGIKTVADIKNFLDKDPRIDKKSNPAYNSRIENVNNFEAVIMKGVTGTFGGQGYQVFILSGDGSIIQFSGNEIPEHELIFRSLKSI